jgi:hypothetical protein
MIYKYPLELTDSQELFLPKDGLILSVQIQRNQIMLWALVDSNVKDHERRIIRIYGTGQEHIPASELRFIATVQMNNGQFVWHVFEEWQN